MASQVTLRALGLNYSPNNLALPEGSLTIANNVIIRRDNVVESRRGYKEYSETFGVPSDRSKQLISYKDRILNHYNDILQYDTGTFDADGKAIFADFNGNYMETESGLRIKSIEANKNLYFTTSKGIKKIAARTAADFTTDAGFIKDAGAVKAVNFYAELDVSQGQQTGFLGLDSTVAYRIVWGYKDLNENLILGAPSDSIPVYNYLANISALDINALCTALDNLTQDGAVYKSVIHNVNTNTVGDTFNGTFSDAFSVKTDTTAEVMRTNLIDIATNIDRFSVLGDVNAIANDKPLQISTIELTNTEATINFSAGNPKEIFRVNDTIELKGITNPPNVFDGSINTVAVQSDDKIIVGGVFTNYAGTSGRDRLVRLNSNGTVDSSFCANASDSSKINNAINAIAVQSDGKILVGGNFSNYAGTSGRDKLIRLNSDGTLDTTFCTNAVDSSKFNGNINSIAIQSDGKILIGGSFTNYAGTSGRNSLVRLNSDGTVDAAFCTNASDSNKFNTTVRAVVLDSSGIIYVGGGFTTYAGNSGRNYLISLNSDGTWNSLFNVDSKFSGNVRALCVDAANFVLVGGEFTNYDSISGRDRLVRLSGGGTVDAAFCGYASDSSKFNASIDTIFVQTDNTIVIGGMFTNYSTVSGRSRLVRLNADGSTDVDFCSNASDGNQFNDGVKTVKSQSTGTLVVCGSFTNYENEYNRFIALNDDGTINTISDAASGNTPPNIAILNNSTDNVYYTVATVSDSPAKITFNHNLSSVSTVSAISPGSSTQLYSYNYRHIVNTKQQDVAAEGSPLLPYSLVDLQIPVDADNLTYATIYSNTYFIISQLKQDASITNSAYISSALNNVYLQYLNNTSSANVKLTINIPSTIQNNKDYFFQIYRTANFSAINQQILGATVIPDDEMNLVYEAYPTPTEFSNLEIVVIDTYPEELRRANVALYSNPATGEGILQANDIPPIAKDINTFKDVTFYANTKTRHRLNPFTLLGTSNISDGDTFIISNGTTIGTSEYEFVTGLQEKTSFTFTGTYSDYANKYFVVNAADDVRKYAIYYKLDNSNISSSSLLGSTLTVNTSNNHNLSTNDTVYLYNFTATGVNNGTIDGEYAITYVNPTRFTVTLSNVTAYTSAQPFFIQTFADKITKVVDIKNSDSLAQIKNKTISVVNSLVYDFYAESTSTTPSPEIMVVTNVNEGITTLATVGTTSNITIALVQDGKGEDAANKKILLSQVASRAQAIDITARSIISVINQNVDSPVNCYYVSNANTLPGIINFESKTLLNVPFYIMSANYATGASFSPDIGPANSPDQNLPPSPTAYISAITAGNPVTITTSENHNLVTGDQILIGNTSTTPSINGIHTIIRTGAKTFTIPVNVTAVASPLGSWSKVSDAVASSNEEKPNRIYYSKTMQPEAVPIGNSFDIGAADKQILRIFPLRDSLFVFKEDGLFRISGETIPFVRTLFDSSCILIAPDSVAVANNVVYAWTNKGISNVTEAGVTEISRPIDTEILKLASSNYTNFSKLTWGLGYDSDNSYTVYTNAAIEDEYPSIAFRYSNLTNTWTNVLRSQTCGVVNLKDDKIYTGSGIYNLIDQERKQFNRLDYSDRDFSILVTDGNILSNGEVIRIVDVDGIKAGDVITQEQKLSISIYNLLLEKLNFDPTVTNDYLTIQISTGVNLRQKIVTLANLLDSDAGLSSTSYYANIADYNGNILTVTPNISTVTITTDGAHGLQTGRIVTIAGTNSIITPSINGTYSVTVTGANTFTIPVTIIVGDSQPTPGVGLTYSTNPNIQKSDDIVACYNILMGMLNAPNSGTTFKNYLTITTTQLFEAVILHVDKKLNQFTVNLPLQWVVGEMRVYQSIPCEIQYAPVTFGDPLKLKQIYEATIMFNNKAFTKGTAAFSSDLKPEFFSVDFYGQGNGIFGHYSNPGFGFGFFGGSSNSAPFRTIIPRETQRSRFINVKFSHSVARELWALYGITLTGNMQETTRAYR
jgi:uncharacterized delta-60 repeat protein